jgi:beta-glucuronidase
MRAILAALAALLALAVPAAALAAATPPQRAATTDGPSGRSLLDGGWSTRADPHDVGRRRDWQRPGFARGFRAVRVPDAFNAQDLTARGMRSRVQWYRTTFHAAQAAGTTGWALRFEAVNRRADVWLNGRPLGGHSGAFAPFELAADGLRSAPGAVNELVVRVDGRPSPSDLPPSTRPRGWWNWGGIVRDVSLRRLTTFDVLDLDAQAAPADPAPLHVTAGVRNASAARTDLTWRLDVTGPDGFRAQATGDAGVVAPGASATVSTDVDIPHPRLWSPADPALYDVRLQVAGGQVRSAHVGVRRFSVRAGRLLLNGAPLRLRGASFDASTPAHGAALTAGDRARIVEQLRALGANAARTQVPPDPALLEAFDRLGIVFWEQLPVWRLTGRELAGPLGDRALRLLRQTMTRDRTHASVVAWSASNETLRGGVAQRRYLHAAASIVHGLVPGGLVAADAPLSPLDALPAALREVDAVGVTDYVGWYGGALPGDLRRDLSALRRRYRDQALLVTEFGAEASRRGSAARKGTYAFQRRFLSRTLDVLDATPWLGGALAWALRDFPVRPGWAGGNPHPDPPWIRKGLFGRSGRPKPAVATVRRRFGAVTGR